MATYRWVSARVGYAASAGPPLIVGLELDGGSIHAEDQKSRDEGWFEVIAGKSMT